jgi:hypothetical protein
MSVAGWVGTGIAAVILGMILGGPWAWRRAKPGGWWDGFWAAWYSRPTKAHRAAHVSVSREALRVALHCVLLDTLNDEKVAAAYRELAGALNGRLLYDDNGEPRRRA